MRRLVIFAALGVAACSSESVPTGEPPPPPAQPEPKYQMPEVWGTTPLEDQNPEDGIVEVWLRAQAAAWAVQDGMVVDGVAYNGVTPGPLLQTKVGDEVIVHFVNDLPVTTTIHWHGLRIPEQMDGTPRVQAPVEPGQEFVYSFTPPEAASFWYHPHVDANQQIERGLYAPLVVHDPEDPSYDLERYLVLDDILVNADGSLPAFLGNHMEEMHGRLGNMLLTNGRASGELRGQAEQGAVERWRVVNTANARTMKLTIEGASVRVIGTDGGLLPTPYAAPELLLPVGQRFDLEVSYDRAGAVVLHSHVLTLDDNGNVVEMPFEVFAVDVAPSNAAPRIIEWPVVELPARAPDADAEIVFDAVQGTTGIEWRINGHAHSIEPLFTFAQGQTVHLALRNALGPEHPFHLHGQFFQIDDPLQPGLKDVVLVPGLSTVNVVAYFDNPGHWMAHCHILEHAELGMMSEIVVTPSGR